jgi:hypothetical protein
MHQNSPDAPPELVDHWQGYLAEGLNPAESIEISTQYIEARWQVYKNNLELQATSDKFWEYAVDLESDGSDVVIEDYSDREISEEGEEELNKGVQDE